MSWTPTNNHASLLSISTGLWLQDSIILVSCLFDLQDRSQESITACFQSYYDQRFPRAKEAYEMSNVVNKITNG